MCVSMDAQKIKDKQYTDRLIFECTRYCVQKYLVLHSPLQLYDNGFSSQLLQKRLRVHQHTATRLFYQIFQRSETDKGLVASVEEICVWINKSIHE